jgi:hypothetical protein
MDLDGGRLRNGTEIFGYGAHRGSNQKWEFIGATEFMLGRQIQVPGPERVVERIVTGPERVIEKIVIKFEDNPEILEELRMLRAQISRAMGGRVLEAN